MLQNEPQTEPPVSPGQVRITPEELNQAVAAIEGRRQAEAQRLAGTIPIEEAVSSLHLDATHEEVWAEVQAQRTAREAEAARHQQARPLASVAPRAAVSASPKAYRPWKRLIAAGVVFSVLWGTGLFPHFGFPSGPTLTISSHSAPAVTSSMAQIPDGQQVYCDTAALVQLSKGRRLSDVRVAQTPGDNTWTLIKMAGHVYLHAYMLPITSVAAQKGQPLILDNDDDSGTLEHHRTARAALRIDGVPLQVSGGDDNFTEITVPNFQPDQFTTASDWR